MCDSAWLGNSILHLYAESLEIDHDRLTVRAAPLCSHDVARRPVHVNFSPFNLVSEHDTIPGFGLSRSICKCVAKLGKGLPARTNASVLPRGIICIRVARIIGCKLVRSCRGCGFYIHKPWQYVCYAWHIDKSSYSIAFKMPI